MAVDLEHVRGIAARVAQSSGLELVDLELRGGGKSRMLRVVIDKPAGVTHEDCANLSREVGAIIDVEDAITGGPYTLEVSSPGLDRKLEKVSDFERFSGRLVKVMTRQPVNNNRYFEGRLQGVAEGRLTLDVSAVSRKKQRKQAASLASDGRLEIELANVERANLVPEI